MTNQIASVIAFFFSLTFLSSINCTAQSTDAIEHEWYNDKKSAKIKIFKKDDGRFYGKIVWLLVPEKDGKPKVDGSNPDKAKRNNPIVGLEILKGFKKKNQSVYDDGTIYDPNNGKTYSCTMTLEGKNLQVRGYVGLSLFGRTTKFTLADD